MPTAKATVVLTPLERIEAEVHEHFGDNAPSENQLAEFLRTSPRMDGGATVIILALIPIILQGYQIYMERERARIGAGGNCPTPGCGAAGVKYQQVQWQMGVRARA